MARVRATGSKFSHRTLPFLGLLGCFALIRRPGGCLRGSIHRLGSYVTKGEMFEDIVSSLGGRVAEQLILDDISTGASNDLQQATNIARQMMSRISLSISAAVVSL